MTLSLEQQAQCRAEFEAFYGMYFEREAVREGDGYAFANGKRIWEIWQAAWAAAQASRDAVAERTKPPCTGMLGRLLTGAKGTRRG